ncbi:MAG TPA: BON domain-containing protein [Thermodesulfobacteriota bacterium]|nr:BON domain-containing protein [Thermodesulfobacteriota bacterium]
MIKKSLIAVIGVFILIAVYACDGDKTTGEVIDDTVITSAVKTKLLADSGVSGFDIDVDTNGGVVELNGTVNTEAESEKAESIAEDVDGVVSVKNNLTVDSSAADSM